MLGHPKTGRFCPPIGCILDFWIRLDLSLAVRSFPPPKKKHHEDHIGPHLKGMAGGCLIYTKSLNLGSYYYIVFVFSSSHAYSKFNTCNCRIYIGVTTSISQDPSTGYGNIFSTSPPRPSGCFLVQQSCNLQPKANQYWTNDI